MPKHLVLSPSGEGWRLPAETNVEDLTHRIEEAMTEQQVIRVDVETGDNPLNRTALLLNGRTLETAAVIELREDMN